MKWKDWPRSENIEDYRDPDKPVSQADTPQLSINEVIELTNSQLARDVGAKDVKK